MPMISRIMLKRGTGSYAINNKPGFSISMTIRMFALMFTINSLRILGEFLYLAVCYICMHLVLQCSSCKVMISTYGLLKKTVLLAK